MVVLTYHKIDQEYGFEKQIQYLNSQFQIVSGFSNKKNGQTQLIITADDGDPSFYYNALPVLKKYKLPAILFIVTDLIDTEKPFWWDELEYYLGKEEGNKKVWEVKTWSNKQRESYLEKLRLDSPKGDLKYKQLTSAQLQEMSKEGIIIANHSHTHPMFDQCTAEELDIEMRSSTEILKELGFSPELFAYPNGNYSAQSEEAIKRYGVRQAYLFDHKINKGEVNPLRISRLSVNDSTPLWKFKLILSGWHSRILPLIKTLGKLKK